jgi:hypothetical protein
LDGNLLDFVGVEQMSGHNLPFDHAAAEWRIPDPGDAGTIRSAQSGVCPMVSTAAGGETRKLADPVYLGQWIDLVLDTDGGDIVLTADSAVNVTGNTVITFDTAGEIVHCRAMTIAGVLKWHATGVAVGTDTDTEGPTFS